MPVPAWEDTAALGPCSGCSQPRVSGAAVGPLRVLLPWGVHRLGVELRLGAAGPRLCKARAGWVYEAGSAGW